MTKSLLAILWIGSLSFAAGCSAGSGPRADVLFPESNEVPGWSSVGQVRTYEASTLWQYVDGGAEKYLQAGVLKALTANYRYKDGLEAVVDIYVMKTGEGALSILESEPAADNRRAEFGDECRLYPNSILFRKARYVVRLIAFRDEPNTGAVLALLGHGIESRIAQQR